MTRRWLLLPVLLLLVIGLLRLGLRNEPLREAEWLIGSTASLGLVMARISSAQSGLLREQLSTRLLLLEPNLIPMEYRSWGLPIAPYQTGREGWVEEADRCRLLVQSGESLNGRLELAGTERQRPLRMEGVLRFGELEGMGDLRRISGWGLRTKTIARGAVHNRALYVVGANFALGVDPLAQPEAWWWRDGERWEGSAPPLPEGAPLTVTVGGIVLQVRVPTTVELDTMPQLLTGERWVSSLLGFPPPVHDVHRVVATFDGGAVVGLLLDRR